MSFIISIHFSLLELRRATRRFAFWWYIQRSRRDQPRNSSIDQIFSLPKFNVLNIPRVVG